MSVLIIDDAVRERTHRVAEHASKRERWYRPGPDAAVPGDDPGHVCRLGPYRCVFSFTVSEGRLYRHLSMSAPGGRQHRYPHPGAAFRAAELFGFTGYRQDGRPAAGWMVRPDEGERCVILAQLIGDAAEGLRPQGSC